jgi:hypothetical protein
VTDTDNQEILAILTAPHVTATDLSGARRWTTLRKRALSPRNVSELRTTQRDRDEFLRGAELLRFYGDRARPGYTPKGQQLLVCDVLAVGHARNVILLPRRSSKSTSVIAVGLGRAEAREDYRCGILTLTSGKAGRSRFLKDVAPSLERLYPDKASRPFKIVRSAGQERIEFIQSGGSVSWLSSIDDLRGEAFDLIILDEAGEADAAKAEEVLAAALPTLDTRPGAQIVAAGTAGRFRTGNLLHDWLTMARAGRGGILDYSVDDQELTEQMLEAWEPSEAHPHACVKDLVLASHPGVGTLTTIESIRNNFESLPLDRFLAEYLGVFGDVGADALLIRPRTWLQAGLDGALPAPERYALGLACHPDQTSASVVAAWRDDDGVAHVMVDRHERGVDWVHTYLAKAGGKVQVGFDSFSAVAQVEVQKLERTRGATPAMEPAKTADIRQAYELFMNDLTQGRLRHYDQGPMNSAAEKAIRRKIGLYGSGFGRQLAEDDITPLEAGAIALKLYDEMPARRTIKAMVST